MRRILFTAVLLASPGALAPALALEAGDTMAAWRDSSDAERSALLKQLFGGVEKAGLRRCIDEASRTPGHAELAIGQIAKACAAAGPAEQPV